MDEKNGQVAHRRMVAGREILRNQRRNNISPGTGHAWTEFSVITGGTAGTGARGRDSSGRGITPPISATRRISALSKKRALPPTFASGEKRTFRCSHPHLREQRTPLLGVQVRTPSPRYRSSR